MLGLQGKVALVTGSTRGIGWATARALARQGAHVVLNGRTDADRLADRVEALAAEFGVESMGVLGDVADPETVQGWYRDVFRRFKRLDVLVNNAGVLHDALLGMIPTQVIQETLNTNTVGTILNLQAASRLIARGGGGSIVNVSSIIGTQGNEGQVVYAASKAAVLGITRAAAKELAPKGIRVNAIAPGFIDTDMTRTLPEDKYAERVASIKMGRIGTAEDIAHAALFFASDLSAYVTGQVLGVDGGMLI